MGGEVETSESLYPAQNFFIGVKGF